MLLRVFSGCLVAALALSTGVAVAQDYPTRTITAIVPFPPGGPTDTITRIVAEHMSRTLGQTIVIENVAGAGGTTGSTRAMRAPPDGYTLLTGHMGTHAAAVGAYPDLAYDPRTDFEPLALLAGTPVLVYGKKALPANNLREFIAYAKANGDKLNNAHSGVGSVAYTTALLLNHLLGIKPTLIPYNGGALLPDVPTTVEAGLPEYQATAWNAMFAPKGTSKPIIDKLNAAIVKALDDATVRRRLLEIGSDIPDAVGRTPAALAALVKSEVDKWTPIVKAAATAK